MLGSLRLNGLCHGEHLIETLAFDRPLVTTSMFAGVSSRYDIFTSHPEAASFLQSSCALGLEKLKRRFRFLEGSEYVHHPIFRRKVSLHRMNVDERRQGLTPLMRWQRN